MLLYSLIDSLVACCSNLSIRVSCYFYVSFFHLLTDSLSSRKIKEEASKSLDTVDNLEVTYASKLPPSLALSNKVIKMTSNMNDDCELMLDDVSTEPTVGSSSLSSIASLGILSNLNDVLEAAAIPYDCSDEDIEEIGPRLSAIDESLSPLISIDYMPKKETIQSYASIESELKNQRTINNLADDDNVLFHRTNIISDIENDINVNNVAQQQEIISLNSIDETEINHMNNNEMIQKFNVNSDNLPVQDSKNKTAINKRINQKNKNLNENKNLEKSLNMHLPTKSKSRSSTLSKCSVSNVPSRLALSASTKSQPYPSNKKLSKSSDYNKQVEFTVMNSKQSSAKSSNNASRTSTPVHSESDIGELNSLCSNSSAGMYFSQHFEHND